MVVVESGSYSLGKVGMYADVTVVLRSVDASQFLKQREVIARRAFYGIVRLALCKLISQMGHEAMIDYSLTKLKGRMTGVYRHGLFYPGTELVKVCCRYGREADRSLWFH